MLYKKRWIILSISFLGLFLTCWLELLLQHKSRLIGGGINRSFLFLLINLHIIIIAILLYIIIKHSLKLLIERRRNIPGSTFKQNLFFAFIFLSVIPSLFVFFTAGTFITTSIQKWFQVHIEQGLNNGLQLHELHTLPIRNALQHTPADIATTQYTWTNYDKETFGHFLKQETAQWRTYRLHNDRTMDSLRLSFIKKIQATKIDQEQLFDFYGSLYYSKRTQDHFHLSIYRYQPPIRNHLIAIQNALHDYAELKSMQREIYKSYYFSFALIVLLILLLSTWCAFYLAKGISNPIQRLLEATENIRQGNLSVIVEPNTQSDLKPLAIAFNAMAKGIQQAQGALENKNKEIMTILESINDSVFYINRHGRIITFNRAAQELINNITNINQLKNRKVSFLPKQIRKTFFSAIKEFFGTKKNSWSKEVSISINQEHKILMVHMSNAHKLDYGVLIVIQDLTEIVKLSKIKAWQEAAKQVAHEIKNPLTPIQLATQRLQRKYQHLFNQEPAFADCTNTILDHVSIIKDLASHFSQFASMPAPHIELIEINCLIKETLQLYHISYPHILFNHTWQHQTINMKTDQEKMKQVLINLLDNSIRALSENSHNPKITIHTEISLDQQNITISFIDNGPGIDKAIQNKLFLPYVSSNKKNMGLGLAIVHDIIRQLGGTIRLVPSLVGAHFNIKLPYA